MPTISKINGYDLKDRVSGYTTNEGTITGVSVAGTSVATSGVANIPAATTSAAGVMSSSDKTKLEGIAAGAEVNVQSDWNITDSTSDAFIKNKPQISNTSITANATNRTLFIDTDVIDGDAVSY